MLHEIDALEARQIAELAGAAREARDRLLEKIPDDRLGEPTPARGTHNPVESLGLGALPGGELAGSPLHDAIAALPAEIIRSLWVVLKTGRGDYARKDWDRAIGEISPSSDDRTVAELLDAADLHDELI